MGASPSVSIAIIGSGGAGALTTGDCLLEAVGELGGGAAARLACLCVQRLADDDRHLREADAVRAVQSGYSGTYAEPPQRTNTRLYGDENPLAAPSFEAKVRLLEEIDAYARAKDPRVRQVTVSFGATWQAIEILRGDGETYRDMRPLVRINVNVVVGDGDRQESGSHGYGGREGYEQFIFSDAWHGAADEAASAANAPFPEIPPGTGPA